jgi:hypothetical protein
MKRLFQQPNVLVIDNTIVVVVIHSLLMLSFIVWTMMSELLMEREDDNVTILQPLLQGTGH